MAERKLQVGVYMDKKMRDATKSAAKREKVPITEFVRRAVTVRIEQKKAKR